MHRSAAEILDEYGPFPGVDHVHGVSWDGESVWVAAGDSLKAIDPASGKTRRSIDVAAHAGTAFDGKHLFQLADDRIQKVDPETGRVLATIPAPGGAGSGRHLKTFQDLSGSVIDSPQLARVAFPGAVPELTVDPGNSGDKAVGLNGA